jgi:hypothetical protein
MSKDGGGMQKPADAALHRARVRLHEIERYLDTLEGLPENTDNRLGNINAVGIELGLILLKASHTSEQAIDYSKIGRERRTS